MLLPGVVTFSFRGEIIRLVKVAQFAPGYFWQTGAVDYTAWSFLRDVKDNREWAQKVCDFMIWKYCFNFTQSAEAWVKMLRAVSKSNELFPIPEEFVYAHNYSR